MIRVYTKERHIQKIKKFLEQQNVKFEIVTKDEKTSSKLFDLGVSYVYPKKIIEPTLSIPKKGFVNYHPGPLPKYVGPNEYINAINNQETHWGVTVHYMNEEFDKGPIIKVKNFDLHEPPTSVEELGAVSHYFLFQLFKETVMDLYNKN